MVNLAEANPAGAAAGSLKRLVLKFAAATWAVGALLLIWLAAARLGWVSERILPDPIMVLGRLETDLTSLVFLQSVLQTVRTSIIGLVIGGLAGGFAAFMLSDGQFRWLYALLKPYLAFLNSTPRIVLVPFFILIFGIGESSRVALSASLVFFVMFFGVFGAVEGLRPEYLRSAHVMGASRLATWRLITFPGTLPGIFDALRVCVALAILGVVVGEIISTPAGLGGLIRIRGEQFDLTGVFSALLVLGTLSAVAMALIKQLEKRMLRWK